MAVKDVREYYAKCIVQKIELEDDFADFNEAFKAGYITEDKLEEVIAEKEAMQNNIDRLAFILYLLEKPNKKDKKKRFENATADILDGFDKLNASDKCIVEENKTILTHIRARLKELTGKTDK